VGYDARVSSPSLFKAFAKGVVAQGKNVLDFGLTSTPMSYFACCNLKADGCAMITASHNPKEYNGVKFTREKAIPISGATGIKEIEEKVLKNDFKKVSKKGKVVKKDVKSSYKKHLSSMIKDIKDLKIVVDPANGMGSQDFSLIKDNLNSEVIPLYFEIDGTYPNHDANPMKEGATDMLKKTVLKEKADLGVAFDGDADRVFFIDDKGNLIPSDYVTALIAEEVLDFNPGSTILYDLRSSWIVPEKIKEFKGKPKMCRVGHSFIKESMRKEKSVFSGELSGHFYYRFDFKEFYSVYDSGIATAIWIMNFLSSKKKKLSSLVKPLKKYFASGEINSEVEDKEGKMKELAKKYKDGKISYLDGVRIDFDDYWFNVRASNTEPLLRLNLEAKTKKMMEKKRDEVLKIIRS
jgi:phosphomannomutase